MSKFEDAIQKYNERLQQEMAEHLAAGGLIIWHAIITCWSDCGGIIEDSLEWESYYTSRAAADEALALALSESSSQSDPDDPDGPTYEGTVEHILVKQ